MHTESYPNIDKVDVISDVHGCFETLLDLLDTLGYQRGQDGLYRHPDDRMPVFVGDIVDRGPSNVSCLEFVFDHVEAGLAHCIEGNHDNKCKRWAKGNPVDTSGSLGETVDQINDRWERDEQEIYDHIDQRWPHVATFDDGQLLVCHAAPPPDHGSESYRESVCLYGHTTGQTTEEGYPIRAEWQTSWDRSDRDTFVVYGHVTRHEPKWTDRTCGIDTACFAGNALTAFRWPECETVSIESHRPELDINMAEDRHVPSVDPYEGGCDMEPIDNLNRRDLLDDLADREEEILWQIDTDSDLKKREHDNGLVIANASQDLYMPEHHHHLYSKGIVYTRDPYKVVSVPFLKMYNWDRNEVSDDLARRLDDRDDVYFEWTQKIDGAMIQLFEHNGETYFTTRSVLEGTHHDIKEDGGFSYIDASRQIAESNYERLTDPSFVDDKTFLFELIHPEGEEGVTRYDDDRKDLVLLAVYDQTDHRYWTNEEVVELGGEIGIETPDLLLDEHNLDRGVNRLLDELEDDPKVPEGAVLCFENDEEILHRVKIKTEAWIRRMKLQYNCSFQHTVDMLWDRPDLWEWDAFRAFLRDEGMTEEEIEDFYREHFDRFKDWIEEVYEKKREIEDILGSYYHRKGTIDQSDLDESEYNKQLALYLKDGHPDKLSLVMDLHRDNGKFLWQVMKAHEPYDGFKGEVIQCEHGS